MISPNNNLTADSHVDYVLQVSKSDLVHNHMPAVIAAEIIERAYKVLWCDAPVANVFDLAVIPDKNSDTYFFNSKDFQGLPKKSSKKDSKRNE